MKCIVVLFALGYSASLMPVDDAQKQKETKRLEALRKLMEIAEEYDKQVKQDQ